MGLNSGIRAHRALSRACHRPFLRDLLLAYAILGPLHYLTESNDPLPRLLCPVQDLAMGERGAALVLGLPLLLPRQPGHHPGHLRTALSLLHLHSS